jgi:NAD(P)H-nitrite reductase large subunit
MVTKLTLLTEELRVAQLPFASLDGVTVVHGTASDVDIDAKTVSYSEEHRAARATVRYDSLCVCTGARPRLAVTSDRLLGIRDTSSVETLRLAVEGGRGARRALIVGNGGIAMELAHEIAGVEVVWAVRERHAGNAFFDERASSFLLPDLAQDGAALLAEQAAAVRKVDPDAPVATSVAPSAGDSAAVASAQDSASLQARRRVRMLFEAELAHLHEREGQGRGSPAARAAFAEPELWPLVAEFADGRVVGCDVAISATGVTPEVSLLSRHGSSCRLGPDGGLLVGPRMQTSVPGVYAAGDCCSLPWAPSHHWFQMRLWSQAKLEGAYLAHCLINGPRIARDADLLFGFNFELFTHVTQFFGMKCIFLGLFNGQGLDPGSTTVAIRCTPGKEFVKFVLKDGRLVGAVMIGDTGLEETAENLILNQIDLSSFGSDILDPYNDLEDFFD